jgi:hypothetical protein
VRRIKLKEKLFLFLALLHLRLLRLLRPRLR